ncbi:hypothetical protein F4775DRAFT_605509 [Biscogniauxia sp. FL1348]|nr:hypothetical protein F4775DRAFT_605509 [Biscogniauxia sp. FL1348]
MDGNSMSSAQRSAKAEAAERCGWRPDSPEQTHDKFAGRCANTHRTPETDEVCSWQGDPPEPAVDDIEERCERAQIPTRPEERRDGSGDRRESEQNSFGQTYPAIQQVQQPRSSGESPSSESQIAAPEPKLPRSPLLENILSIGGKRKSVPEVPPIVIPTHQMPSSAPQSTTTEANPFLDPSPETQAAVAEPQADEEASLSGRLSRTFRGAFGAVLERIRTPTPPPPTAGENTDTSSPQRQLSFVPLHPPSESTTQLPLLPQPDQPEEELTPVVPIPEELPERLEKQGKPKRDKAAEKEEKTKAKEAKAQAKKEQKAEKKREKERLRQERRTAKQEKHRAKHEEHVTKRLESEAKHMQKEAKHGKSKDKGHREKKNKGEEPGATAHEPSPPGGAQARCDMCQSNEGEAKFSPIKDLMNGWESLPPVGELVDAAKKLIARKDMKATTEPPAAAAAGGEEPDYDVLVEHVADHIAEHVHQRLSSSDQPPPRHPCGKLAIDGLEHTCGAQCRSSSNSRPASHGLDGNRDSPTPAGGSQVVCSPPARRDFFLDAPVMRPSPMGALTFPAVNSPIDRAMSPWNQRLGLKTSPPYSSHIRSPMRGFDWGPFSRSRPLTPYAREAAACHHHICVPVMPMISSLCLEARCAYDVGAASASPASVVSVTPPGLAETLPPNSPPRTPSPRDSSSIATATTNTLRINSLPAIS